MESYVLGNNHNKFKTEMRTENLIREKHVIPDNLIPESIHLFLGPGKQILVISVYYILWKMESLSAHFGSLPPLEFVAGRQSHRSNYYLVIQGST